MADKLVVEVNVYDPNDKTGNSLIGSRSGIYDISNSDSLDVAAVDCARWVYEDAVVDWRTKSE